MTTIYEKLKAYSDSDYYGFHMPGHKRKMHMSWDADPYTVDITEIEGFDDLHHAEGILKEAQERAARIYHADETHFLVNGSIFLIDITSGTIPFDLYVISLQQQSCQFSACITCRSDNTCFYHIFTLLCIYFHYLIIFINCSRLQYESLRPYYSYFFFN